MQRICPACDCTLPIPNSMFCCRFHWGKLTADLRRAINRTYRAFVSSPGPETVDALKDVQKRATEHLDSDTEGGSDAV